MTQDEVRKILEVGVLLSSERNLNRLLEQILSSVMEIANCDAGTLYLLNKDKLYFTIMHNKTMEIYLGGSIIARKCLCLGLDGWKDNQHS